MGDPVDDPIAMRHTATVLDTYRITPRVKGFRLRVPGHEFDHGAGQHTTVRFEADGEAVERPYTPTNRPGTDELLVAIKRYDGGVASTCMHGKDRGDEVTLGPLEGNLALADPDRDAAFLSTGTGITAMVALARRQLAVGDGDAHFVHGEKRAETLIFRGALNELAADEPALELTFTLSDPGPDWTGPTGYVQSHLVDLFEDFETRDFYVCGVPEMVVETTATLAELGTPPERIHTEGWEDGAVEDVGS